MRGGRKGFVVALVIGGATGCLQIVGSLDPFSFAESEAGAADGAADTTVVDARIDATNDDAATDAPSDDRDAADAADADAGCMQLALHFGVPTAGVAIADSPALALGAAGTMEAWFYPETVQNDAGAAPNIFNKFQSSAEDKRIWVFPNLTPIGFLFPSVDLIGSTPATKNQWNHLALSWSASGQTLYLNGSVAASGGAPTPANASGGAHIGYLDRGGVTNPPLFGFISEVRISNVARYTTVVFVPPPHLVNDANTTAFWKLDEGTGTQAKDSTATANHGTISNATWSLAPCR